LMARIKESNTKISMLVANNKGTFLKKAQGRITFTCIDGDLVEKAIKNVLNSDEGHKIWLKSEGVDSKGDVVSIFNFEWTLKKKLHSSIKNILIKMEIICNKL